MENWRIAIAMILQTAVASGLVSGCSDESPTGANEGGLDASGPEASASTANGPDASGGPDGGEPDASNPEAGQAVEAGSPADAGPESGGDASCSLPDGGIGDLCINGCVDLQTDPANCGVCGRGCDPGALCSSASCLDVAGSLTGLRWELPCTNTGNICTTVSKITQTVSLKGLTGQPYQVTLHFRGVVEEETYAAGDAGDGDTSIADGGSNPQLFQVGGSPVNTSANVYELDVDKPAQTFFLNSGMSSVSYVAPIDYVATIVMQGGATLTLIADPVDGLEYSNQGQDGGAVIPAGVPPAPDAYKGQFVQMDVVAVTVK